MKSLEKRLEKVENKVINISERENIPTNLKEIYAKEDNPETETYKQLQELYK